MIGKLADFAAVYDAHAEEIYDFLYYKTFDQGLAEDLTSATFMKALEHYEDFQEKEGATVKSWLYRIARNTVIDHYRTKKHDVTLEDTPELSDATSLEEDVDTSITLDEVKAAMNALPEAMKEIIVLRVWQELSFAEIGQVLGKSEDAAKMAFSRAIRLLRSALC